MNIEEMFYEKIKYNNMKFDLFDVDKNADSYYKKIDFQNNIMQYDFQTVSELNELIEDNWKKIEVSKDIIKDIDVVAIKNKLSDEDLTNESEIEIPDYIYVF